MAETKNTTGNVRKILLTMPQGDIRDSFVPASVLAKLGELGELRVNQSSAQFSPDELARELEDVEICVTGWGCPAFSEPVLRGANCLKLVAHTGGTVAPIVSPALFDMGVRVISGNKMYAESTAEGAFAYIFTGLRRIPEYAASVQSGGWSGANPPTEGLLDQTVGLVGFGAVAKNLARMLKPLRVNILAYDPFVSEADCALHGVTKVDDLSEILERSKIVSLHLPRVKETYHIISSEMLRKIPDGALLVNTSRGSVVDEKALEYELKAGRFRAVLDVFEEEPLPPDSGLRGIPGAILMPHLAGPTLDRRPMITLALIEDIKRMVAGEPLIHEIKREYALSMTNDSLKL